MKAVIDTNVVISSTLSLNGKPAEIMKLFYTSKLQLFYTVEIFAEYKRVLAYKKLSIAEETQFGIINALEVGGTFVESPTSSTISFTDESDRIFYDTAKANDAILITGNIKHYPDDSAVMTPADFLLKAVI